ncbi:CBM35 domain-containing protein [Streptomyces sp. NPDC046203]|uniref:CBM35 domain-containing protein n=1 Tax=Streptomyces sp. NPDC046203 TaxID=3154602 RepID=UPI003401099E
MAAGNDGAKTPEDDDPFGYLYADGQAAGAQPPQGGGYGYPGPMSQPGVPRTSYNQVRTVGERQYGAHAQQPPMPQQQGQPQGQGYGQPHAQYAAPETYAGGPGGPGGQRPGIPQQHQPGGYDGGGSGRGPNTRGLLIGAVAVVAVVVLGIAAAVISNRGTENDTADGGETTTAPTSAPTEAQTAQPSEEVKPPAELPKQDAATLRLGGPAALAKDIPGAKSEGGAYVNFNGQGGSASWSVSVPKSGDYTLYITYSVPGKDAETSLTVNAGAPRSINMSNFARAADGDWAKGWTNTYAYVKLNKGDNALKISCEAGDQCEVILDQVSLKAGQPK